MSFGKSWKKKKNNIKWDLEKLKKQYYIIVQYIHAMIGKVLLSEILNNINKNLLM